MDALHSNFMTCFSTWDFPGVVPMEFTTKTLQPEAQNSPLEHVQDLTLMILMQYMGKDPSKFPIPGTMCG